MSFRHPGVPKRVLLFRFALFRERGRSTIENSPGSLALRQIGVLGRTGLTGHISRIRIQAHPGGADGAGDETRTRDIQLGRLALYH